MKTVFARYDNDENFYMKDSLCIAVQTAESQLGVALAFFSAFLFPEARLLLVSTKNHDLWKVQFSEHRQGNHFLFSANQICHTDSEHVESDSDSQCITDFWCWTSFLNVAILGADQKRVWSLGTRLSFLCLPRNAALVLCDNPS